MAWSLDADDERGNLMARWTAACGNMAAMRRDFATTTIRGGKTGRYGEYERFCMVESISPKGEEEVVGQRINSTFNSGDDEAPWNGSASISRRNPGRACRAIRFASGFSPPPRAATTVSASATVCAVMTSRPGR